MQLSAPPQIATSTSPVRIMRAPSPIACKLAGPALIDGVHCLFHRGEAADAGADDCGGAVALGVADGNPRRLSDCLVCGGYGELDKAIHSHLVLETDDALRIEAAFGILRRSRHDARNLCGYVADEIVSQPAYAGSPGEKPSPDQARATTKRGNDAGTGDNNASHFAPAA